MAKMPVLDFICASCKTQQFADGKCANCGSTKLLSAAAASPVADYEKVVELVKQWLVDTELMFKVTIPESRVLIDRITTALESTAKSAREDEQARIRVAVTKLPRYNEGEFVSASDVWAAIAAEPDDETELAQAQQQASDMHHE